MEVPLEVLIWGSNALGESGPGPRILSVVCLSRKGLLRSPRPVSVRVAMALRVCVYHSLVFLVPPVFPSVWGAGTVSPQIIHGVRVKSLGISHMSVSVSVSESFNKA